MLLQVILEGLGLGLCWFSSAQWASEMGRWAWRISTPRQCRKGV